MKIGISNGQHYDRETISVSTLTTIPESAASGMVLITTAGVNFTVGNANVLLKAGDWIWDKADEVRKVVNINSDVNGCLNEPFSSDILGETFQIIDGDDLSRIWAIDFKPIGTADTIIDGVAFSSDDTFRISIPSTDEASVPKQIKPVVIDGSSDGDCEVIVHRLV